MKLKVFVLTVLSLFLFSLALSTACGDDDDDDDDDDDVADDDDAGDDDDGGNPTIDEALANCTQHWTNCDMTDADPAEFCNVWIDFFAQMLEGSGLDAECFATAFGAFWECIGTDCDFELTWGQCNMDLETNLNACPPA